MDLQEAHNRINMPARHRMTSSALKTWRIGVLNRYRRPRSRIINAQPAPQPLPALLEYPVTHSSRIIPPNGLPRISLLISRSIDKEKLYSRISRTLRCQKSYVRRFCIFFPPIGLRTKRGPNRNPHIRQRLNTLSPLSTSLPPCSRTSFRAHPLRSRPARR